jgi:hypothetical protein
MLCENDEWYTFEYNYTTKFKDHIKLLLNQSEFNFITRVNSENRIVILIISGVNGKRKNIIEVNNYSINIKSKFKESDLSKESFILEELRHLQIIVRMK